MIATASTLMNVAEPSALALGNLALADRPQRVHRQSRRASDKLGVLGGFARSASPNDVQPGSCSQRLEASRLCRSRLGSSALGLRRRWLGVSRHRHPESEYRGRSPAVGRIVVRSKRIAHRRLRSHQRSAGRSLGPSMRRLDVPAGRGAGSRFGSRPRRCKRSCPTYPSAKVAGHVQQP